MTALLACLAAIAGYYAWQRSRYQPRRPAEAHGRALADAAALAVIIACLWIANELAVRWGVIQAQGTAAAVIGAIFGVLLAGPTRRAVLRAQRIDPGASL